MKEDDSAILMCLVLFSHSTGCFVSSLENLCGTTVLGAGRSGLLHQNRRWRERGPGLGPSIRPGSAPGPHPVLSQLGGLGALTR